MNSLGGKDSLAHSLAVMQEMYRNGDAFKEVLTAQDPLRSVHAPFAANTHLVMGDLCTRLGSSSASEYWARRSAAPGHHIVLTIGGVTVVAMCNAESAGDEGVQPSLHLYVFLPLSLSLSFSLLLPLSLSLSLSLFSLFVSLSLSLPLSLLLSHIYTSVDI